MAGKLRIVDFDENILSDLPVQHVRITKATYMRMYIPKLFAKIYEKVVYMDVDVHIRHARLGSLFDLDRGDHAVAAVRGVQSFARATDEHLAYFNGLGLSHDGPISMPAFWSSRRLWRIV